VIAAIYESVLRPELYDAFMAAWSDHIAGAIADTSRDGNSWPVLQDATLDFDPELRAHFTRAYEILERIGRQAPQGEVSEKIRDLNGFSLAFDRAGRVLARSQGAATVPLGQVAALDDVTCDLDVGSVDLLRALQAAMQTDDADQVPVVLTTASRPRHLLARLVRTIEPDGATRVLLVLEALEYQWSDRAAASLSASFGLTRAELDVVRHVLQGRSLKEIAEQSGRSEHTVRNQAKSVLAKTGAPSQVDLIRLVVFLIRTEADRPDPKGADGALPGRRIRMGDGLVCEVFEFGPDQGQPVLFLHGMLDGVSALQVHRAKFEAAGLRVIAPIRPGFGQSEPAARPELWVDTHLAHIVELLEDYRQKPVILGHLAGACYGFILAARHPEMFAGMVAVGGSAPMTSLGQISYMRARQRVVAYTARFAPALLPVVLRAGIAQIDGKTIQQFMEALYPEGTCDRLVIEDLNVATHIQAAYRYSVRQGHVGFAADSYLVVRDWSDRIMGRTPPIRYLNGRHDPVVPADQVAEFFAKREEVDVTILEEAGQFILYQSPELVIETIAGLVA
jgi:pimeloyl-ACP methyl ester carboxylesterase/DNA-binding CsgD family transcriptional regulator